MLHRKPIFRWKTVFMKYHVLCSDETPLGGIPGPMESIFSLDYYARLLYSSYHRCFSYIRDIKTC